MQTVCDLQTDKQIEYIIETAAKPLPRESKAPEDKVMVPRNRVCFLFSVKRQKCKRFATYGRTNR